MVAEAQPAEDKNDPFILKPGESQLQAETDAREIHNMDPKEREILFSYANTILDAVIDRTLSADTFGTRLVKAEDIIYREEDEPPSGVYLLPVYHVDHLESKEYLDDALSDTLGLRAEELLDELEKQTGRNMSPVQIAFDRINMIAQRKGFDARKLILFDAVPSIGIEMGMFAEDLLDNISRLRDEYYDHRVWEKRPRFGAKDDRDLLRAGKQLFRQAHGLLNYMNPKQMKPGLEAQRRLWEWYADMLYDLEAGSWETYDKIPWTVFDGEKTSGR